MRNWFIPAGKLFGVELRIHLAFITLLLFVWLTEFAAHMATTPMRCLALVGIVFGSVVLHEIGHLLVAAKLGLPAKAIVLLPIGGVTLPDEAQRTVLPPEQEWKREVNIAAVGPLVNLLVGLAAAGVVLIALPEAELWSGPYIFSGNLPRTFVWCNIGLGLLNLLPAYPLDGGRVLRALFSRRLDPVHATRRAVSIGSTIATIFMVAGLVQYAQGVQNGQGGPPTAAWLAMIGFFLLLAAQMEERSIVFQRVLQTVRLEDIMLTDFATLSPADTLEDALEKAVHSLQDDFPVIRGVDMVGVVSKQKILHALRADGNGYVQSVMSRIFEVAQKKESLASAFRKLTARNLSIIPVVEDQKLVGIVTLQNLMHSMALLAESRKLRRESLGD